MEGETIEATLLHPFWVVRGVELEDRPRKEHLPIVPTGATTPGRWVDAGDLRIGDQLLLRDGRIMPVETIQQRPFHNLVYNFEVEELHCYAVGNHRVLVHNSNASEIFASMGRPTWANTAGGFVNWLSNLQKNGRVLTQAEADAIIEECNRLGIYVRLDPPHPGTAWNVHHLNIGNKNVHLQVPPSYTNPTVPTGSPTRPRP